MCCAMTAKVTEINGNNKAKVMNFRWSLLILLDSRLYCKPRAVNYKSNSYPISRRKFMPSKEIFSRTFFDFATASGMVFP